MYSWRIERTRTQMIFDERGSPISGIVLDVILLPWGEYHEVEVASMDEDLVKKKLDTILGQRIILEDLSTPPESE